MSTGSRVDGADIDLTSIGVVAKRRRVNPLALGGHGVELDDVVVALDLAVPRRGLDVLRDGVHRLGRRHHRDVVGLVGGRRADTADGGWPRPRDRLANIGGACGWPERGEGVDPLRAGCRDGSDRGGVAVAVGAFWHQEVRPGCSCVRPGVLGRLDLEAGLKAEDGRESVKSARCRPILSANRRRQQQPVPEGSHACRAQSKARW